MIELTAEQWNEYDKRYGKLIYKIAQRITGDNMICSIEDNVADLQQAALESINGFYRKMKGQGEEVNFDQMMEMKYFDQYTKTCLWHKKNNKGKGIKRKYPLNNKLVSISENEEVLSVLAGASDFIVEDMTLSLTGIQKDIVDAVYRDPGLVMSNGKINVSALSQTLGKSPSIIGKEVFKLKRVFKRKE